MPCSPALLVLLVLVKSCVNYADFLIYFHVLSWSYE